VALAASLAGMIATTIEVHQATRMRTSSGCIRRLSRAGCSGVLGCGAAGIFAAAIVERFPESPWMVVATAVAGGLAIDITTRAGFDRLFKMILRLNLALAKTLSDEEPKP
jgi:hypothetical protein